MDESSGSSSTRVGIIFGLICYGSWGLIPLYFNAFKADHVPATQILAHRIVWSLALLVVLTLVLGRWREVIRVLSSRRLVGTLALSAAVLAVNWLVYIYATVTDRVSETSLGYFMLPLMNAFIAATVLGEKLRRAHYPALGLIGCAVLIPIAWRGELTWVPLAVTVSFALYTLVRKLAPVDGMTGLTVETLVLFVPSLCWLVFAAGRGEGRFGPDPRLNGLLMLGGVVTAFPLVMFGLSVRRMPLLMNSFIQFVSPTIQLLIAVFWIGETVTPDRWAAMGFVWVAVCVFLADAAAQLRAKPVAAPEPIPDPPAEPEILANSGVEFETV